MFHEYLPILMMALMGIAMGGALALVAYFFGPKVTDRVKNLPFESGLMAVGTNKQKIGVKFYLVAMIFLVFDIEIIFLYPYAVNFREFGWPGFLQLFFFIAVLSIGVLYEIKKGVLEW